MSSHHYVFIGLLSVLFFFKRTRYASSVYLVAYLLYLYALTNGMIPDAHYHVISSTLNAFIFISLFVGYEYKGLNSIFNLHNYSINQLVGILSILLVVINLVGWVRYSKDVSSSPTVYNSDYRFIVGLQITLLYIGNMINAWVDRRDHKLVMVFLTDSNYFETFDEVLKEEGK